MEKIKIVINESFTNAGVDIPFDYKLLRVSEGRVLLYEDTDYIIDHYRLFFTDEFLNECSMNNEIIIEIRK